MTTIEFKDITTEKFRVYAFESGAEIRVENPLKLNVSASGGHRILDARGVSHYIPAGWIHLRWEVKDGAPNFSF